jgi:hypothetical protein
MSISQKNLSSIQKAGQAAHDAAEAILVTMRAQAESMVASMASQPFSAESEQAIVRFKTLSRLSQGLVAIEAQLQELYAVASDLANPASDVVVVKQIRQRKNSNALAVDVVEKPAKAIKAAKAAKAKKGGRKAATLTANDSALLQYLQGVLKAGEWTAQTGSIMAAGSGLPLGSVGLSLKKILASGAVKAGERGLYQLGNAVTATDVKNASAKKAKPALAKKARAVKTAKVQVPAATEVKANPSKKVNAAPAKKAKAAAPKKVKAVEATAAEATADAQAALV